MTRRRENPVLLIAIIVGALLLMGAVIAGLRAFAPVSTYRVMSASMEPSLHQGETVLASGARALCGPRKIARGDVIIFRLGDQRWMKRVVGLGGETIAIHGPDIVINGAPLPIKPLGLQAVPGFAGLEPEPIRRENDGREKTWLAVAGTNGSTPDVRPTKLAADQLFVLGDNRADSIDSRNFGPVAQRDVCAVVMSVVASPIGGRTRVVS